MNYDTDGCSSPVLESCEDGMSHMSEPTDHMNVSQCTFSDAAQGA